MKKSILFLAAFAALVSCTKENPVDENPVLDTPVVENQSITFEATAPSTASDDATKTTLVEGSLVHWVKGDAVKVMFVPINGYGSVWPGYEYDGASGVMTATFDSETSASALFTGSLNWGPGSEYMGVGIAVYPSSVETYSHRNGGSYKTNAQTVISYNLPSNQTAVENSFQNGVVFSYAEIDNVAEFAASQSKLKFENACALIKVTLPSDATDIVSLTVESSNATLSGKHKVNSYSGDSGLYAQYYPNFPLVMTSDGGVNNVTLSAPAGETLKAGASYYIVTWPGSHTNGLSFTFTNTSGLTHTKQLAQSVELEESKIDHFNFTNPIVFEHKFEVSNDSFSVDCGENSGQFTVLSSRDWTAASSESWLTVSTKSGSASANPTTVEFTAAANSSTEERTATITIEAGEDTKTVSVTQAAFVPEMTLSQTSLSFEDVATTGSFTVTSNVYWDASSDQTWLTLSPNSGSPSSFASGVTVNVEANTSNDERTATITVTGIGITRTIAVTQAGAPKTSGFKKVRSVYPTEMQTGKYYVIANQKSDNKYWTVGADGFLTLAEVSGDEFNAEYVFEVAEAFSFSNGTDFNGNSQNYSSRLEVNLKSKSNGQYGRKISSSRKIKFDVASMNSGLCIRLGGCWNNATTYDIDIFDSGTYFFYTPTDYSSVFYLTSSYKDLPSDDNAYRKWYIYEVQ